MKKDFQKIPLIFNVYKPSGPSSFSVVHHFKKNLDYNFGKIGHFGTLDPFAEGVLLIGVQGAQRLNDYIHEILPKTYRAIGVFGGKTDTGDLTSLVTTTKDLESIYQNYSLELLESKLKSTFLGEYWQAPHAVSATKFEGKRLYEHALSGRIITKDKVKREILDIKILKYQYPEMEFIITVSSGTYIRSFFEEVSTLFGGVGALRELERVAIGENTSSQAMKERDWPQKGKNFSLEEWGRPLDEVLVLDKVQLELSQTTKYLQGQRLQLQDVSFILKKQSEASSSSDLVWVYGPGNWLLGLARVAAPELHAIFNLQLSISRFLP